MGGHLYFVGIAGHAMRGLALAARDNGYEVTGLDPSAVPPGSDWLDQQGFTWAKEYRSEQLDGVTDIIITGAHVTPDSPVIQDARRRDIPVQSYAEFFGQLTKFADVIAVAGTHGKTTTTALIAWLLESAGAHPDFLIGIQPYNFPASVRFTGSQVAVVEADEYKASSLDTRSKAQHYHADTLVLTSVEHDHPDLFLDLKSVINRFHEIVAAIPASGHLVAWAESDTVVGITEAAACPVITYGLEKGDYQARDIEYLPEGIALDIIHAGRSLGRITTQLYGEHNVLNVLGAAAAVLSQGIDIEKIIAGAATFKGAYRRFNIVSEPTSKITVIDDYAHHSTEVATNIEAAKLHFPGRRVVAVFRPHTYTRIAALLPEYQQALSQANLAYVTDIEGARETGKQPTVSGQDIVDKISASAHFVAGRADLIKQIIEATEPGDVILCMTVSGYDDLAPELAVKTAEIA
ncbi:MAG: UDP-N-acetylmuramate:L-alanyl-gamma-D-glutamyl-meso-diaminopimelate ligase [Candidatus Saccharimonadales bacterium]